MKKILLRTLVLVMSISIGAVFSLGSCAPAVEEPVVEEPVVEEPVVEEGEEQVQEIEFTTVVPPDHPIGVNWQKVADDYMEENPNVKIIFNYIAYEDYFTQISLRVLSGNPPDIADHGYSTSEFVDADALVEMGPYLEESGWEEDDFWQGLWDITVYDGKQYGVPYTLDTRTFQYNKDMFEEAGVDIPETWDDILEIAPTIKEATGAYAIGLDGTPPAGHVWQFITPIVFSNGGEWITQNDEGLWEANASSPEVLEAVEIAKNLVDSGAVIPSWPTNDNHLNQTLLLQEQIASLIVGPWAYSFYDDERAAGTYDFEIDQALIPKQKEHASVMGGWSWYVFKSDQYKEDVCWDIINYFLQPENIAKGWCDSLPPTKAGMDVGVYSEDPRYDWVEKALENSKFPVQPVSGFFEMLNLISEYSMNAILGEKPIEQAMQELDVKLQKVLDQKENALILKE